MRDRFYLAGIALLILSVGHPARAADDDTFRIPVLVSFKYGGAMPIKCGNAPDVGKAIAQTLSQRIKPYHFIAGPNEAASHLRLELSRERSQNMSMKGDLYGYSIDGMPSVNSVPEGPFDMGMASYGDGLPPCADWPDKVNAIISTPAALGKLRTDLLNNMPFAKGVRVLNPPPPLPQSPLDGRLLILAPMEPEFASNGQFDLEYDQAKRMVVIGVACTTDNLIVVEPRWTDVTTNNVDYAKLNGNSKNLLIYAYTAPSRRIVECNSDTQLMASPGPSALPRVGNAP